MTGNDYKELLRLEHVSSFADNTSVLDDFSMTVLEGEQIQVTGLADSGIDELGKILSGESSFSAGKILLGEKVFNKGAVIRGKENKIYTIKDTSYFVPEMTIAENLFLHAASLFGIPPGKKAMKTQTRELLTHFGLNLEPDMIYESLSSLDRDALAFIKAYISNPKLIVVRGLSGVPYSGYDQIERIRSELKKEKIAVIVFSGYGENYDKTVIIRDGSWAKTFYHGDLPDSEGIERAVPYTVDRNIQTLEPRTHDKPVTDSVSFVNIGIEHVSNVNFSVRKGEILGLYDTGKKETCPLLRSILSGERTADEGQIFIQGKEFRPDGIERSLKAGIGFIDGQNIGDALIENMTVFDNIMLPSLRKAPLLGGMRNYPAEQSVRRLLKENELAPFLDLMVYDLPQDAPSLPLLILFCRWDVFRPKLLVYNEPFFGLDALTHSIIEERLNKLSSSGISIILTSRRYRDLMQCSDRVICFRDGEMVS